MFRCILSQTKKMSNNARFSQEFLLSELKSHLNAFKFLNIIFSIKIIEIKILQDYCMVL